MGICDPASKGFLHFYYKDFVLEMMPHTRNSFSNFEHPFKMFSSLLILMSHLQISHSKSRVPKPHFCWLPHTNEGYVGKLTSPPLPMVRTGTHCDCLLPVSLPFRIARLHCTLLLGPKILRWSTSYWIMVLLQMLLIRSINLCFLVCRKLACKAGVFCFDIDLDF